MTLLRTITTKTWMVDELGSTSPMLGLQVEAEAAMVVEAEVVTGVEEEEVTVEAETMATIVAEATAEVVEVEVDTAVEEEEAEDIRCVKRNISSGY